MLKLIFPPTLKLNESSCGFDASDTGSHLRLPHFGWKALGGRSAYHHERALGIRGCAAGKIAVGIARGFDEVARIWSRSARNGASDCIGNFGGTRWPVTPTRKRIRGGGGERLAPMAGTCFRPHEFNLEPPRGSPLGVCSNGRLRRRIRAPLRSIILAQ